MSISGKFEIAKNAPLLRMALSPSASDGERANALRALDRYLTSIGSDEHELVERFEVPPLDKAGMQKIFDAGYQKRVDDEADQRHRAVVAVTASSASDGIGEGHRGYSWAEIVGHCLLNKHLILDAWQSNFVESVAEQLAYHGSKPSAKQAQVLRRVFNGWFGGKIT